jgi:hypothetical protein
MVIKMDISLTELKRDLVLAIDSEESENPDWDFIAETSSNWVDRLNLSGCQNLIDESVYHFLEDFEVRQSDSRYGRQQRRKVKIRLK